MNVAQDELLLEQLEQNENEALDKLVNKSRDVRRQYQQSGKDDGDTARIPLLEQQKNLLIDYLYTKDLDFLRSSPSEDETRARLAKIIQQSEVDTLPVSSREAIELAVIQLYHHGIMQPLMDASQPDITDVLVFGTYGIMYRRHGKNHWFVDSSGERVRFRSHEELRRYVERKLGTEFQLDLSAPSTNAIFPDGSRIMYRSKAIGFSDWINGQYVLFTGEPILAIRRFGHPYSLEELMEFNMLTPRMRAYLALIPQIRDSFLVGGQPGVGKSTLQNAMLEYLPQDELTAVLEDTPDAKARGGFYVRLYTQEANAEGKGEITIARNLFDAKRMAFQNVIVGEMRDGQSALRASDVAMMTSGLFSSTIHATTPDKMVRVYTNMLMSAPERPNFEYSLDLFATSFQQLIAVEMIRQKPLITTIGEVLGVEGSRVNWRTVFEREYSTRKVIFHGLSPRMMERAYKYDIEIPLNLLQPGEEPF